MCAGIVARGTASESLRVGSSHEAWLAMIRGSLHTANDSFYLGLVPYLVQRFEETEDLGEIVWPEDRKSSVTDE